MLYMLITAFVWLVAATSLALHVGTLGETARTLANQPKLPARIRYAEGLLAAFCWAKGVSVFYGTAKLQWFVDNGTGVMLAVTAGFMIHLSFWQVKREQRGLLLKQLYPFVGVVVIVSVLILWLADVRKPTHTATIEPVELPTTSPALDQSKADWDSIGRQQPQ